MWELAYVLLPIYVIWLIASIVDIIKVKKNRNFLDGPCAPDFFRLHPEISVEDVTPRLQWYSVVFIVFHAFVACYLIHYFKYPLFVAYTCVSAVPIILLILPLFLYIFTGKDEHINFFKEEFDQYGLAFIGNLVITIIIWIIIKHN